MTYGADKLKMGQILTFKLYLTLKVKCTPQNSIDLNQGIFRICGLNFVILAWLGAELSHRQACHWHTHRPTLHKTV